MNRRPSKVHDHVHVEVNPGHAADHEPTSPHRPIEITLVFTRLPWPTPHLQFVDARITLGGAILLLRGRGLRSRNTNWVEELKAGET
jgi:hypothetical protein